MGQKTDREILNDIESGAKDVRAVGAELATRIKNFESWLNKLPGRVRAECVLSTSEHGFESRYLCFEKEGKAWSLFVYNYHHGADEMTDWKPLRDTTLEEKNWAVKKFPDLLRAMAEAQRTLVDRIRTTNTEFDTFAKSVGIPEGE